MSFKIERGFFKLDFTDFYAILGVPVDAKPDEIRKRYLKIAQVLHPDKCKAETAEEKHRASQILSKLVNPAYEQLYKDKSRNEYVIVLGRMGKRLAAEPAKAPLQTDAAKQLMQAGGNLEHIYKSTLQKLAAGQYESVSNALDIIGQISELNIVYVMKKDIDPVKKSAPAAPPPPPSGAVKTPVAAAPRPEEKKAENTASAVEAYYRRAQEYMTKNVFSKAILELRDALQQEPNNSRCHALLGIAYLKQGQLTMAKVHVNKALQINPQEADALKTKEILDKLAQKAAASNAGAAGKGTPSQPQGKPPQGSKPDKPDNKSGGGGLFGGLFGGKKK